MTQTSPFSESSIAALNDDLQDASPRDVLLRLLPLFQRCALSFSGAEDVVAIEHALNAAEKSGLEQLPEVFTLDTGRLPAATLRYLETVRLHYGITLTLLTPNSAAVQALVSEKGLFSFYEDGHEECCAIRKLEPLRAHLPQFDAWISGQRKDQSPTRSALPVVEIDSTFAAPHRQLVKINPLANSSSEDVWNTIRSFDIPYNELHDQGFVSLGCEPCTKAIGPNQHEREGRWWWEEATAKECGLHLPVKQL